MKEYAKIDIYTKNTRGIFVYETSAVGYKTLKECKDSFLRKYNFLDSSQVKCKFASK